MYLPSLVIADGSAVMRVLYHHIEPANSYEVRDGRAVQRNFRRDFRNSPMGDGSGAIRLRIAEGFAKDPTLALSEGLWLLAATSVSTLYACSAQQG